MRKRWEETLTETEKIHQVSRQMAEGGGGKGGTPYRRGVGGAPFRPMREITERDEKEVGGNTD